MDKKILTRTVPLLMCMLCCILSGVKAQNISGKITGTVQKAADTSLNSGKALVRKAGTQIDTLPAKLSAYTGLQKMKAEWETHSEKAKAQWQGLSLLKKVNPNFYVENAGVFLNSPTEGKNSQWYNITTLGLQLHVAGLPLNFQFSGQYNPVTGYQFGNSNLFKLQMASLDPRERLNRMVGNFDEENLKRELVNNISSQGKQLYKEQLAAAEELIPGKEDVQIKQFLHEQGGISGLLSKNEAEFHRTLLIAKNREEEKIKQKKDVTIQEGEALKRKSTGRFDSLAHTIRDIKGKLKSLGINDERSQLLHRYFKHEISEENLQQGFLQSFTEGKAQLSKSQSLLSRLKSFKTGDFGQAVPGNMLNRDLFMKGLDFSFNGGNMPLTLGFGKRNDMASAKDALFEQSAFSAPNMLTYLNASIYRFSGITGKLAIVNSSSQPSMGNSGSNSVLTAPRNNFAISFSQDMQLKKLGQLSVELSRASNSYSNGGMQVSELNFVRNDALSSFFNTELDQSLSIGLKHQLDLEKAGLSQSVYFNYAGIGYQSPGSNGNLNTRMRLGGSVRKSLFERRLTLNIRGDLRNTPISINGSDAWRNHQLQTDASIRITRKTTLRLSYNNNATSRVNEVVIPTFRSEKYQAGINLGYKLMGQQALSHVTVGQQYFGNFGETNMKGNFFTVNLAQTILLGNNMLSGNVFYNREVSEVKMMGNMLNADMAYQFSVLKHLMLAPGLTYLDNKGVARQMGIKNSIQYTGGKHFSVGGSADVRKNFYDPLFPQLYTNCRAELNFTYYLKNKP